MRRHRLLLAAVGCLGFLAAGCWNVLPPQGAAPLRYRDQIFTNVTVTNGANSIVYGSGPKQDGTTQTLLLDMYQPTGDTVTKRPAIVWVHGGSFAGGNRTSPELVDEANYFSREGYVNVSIEYRLGTFGGCTPGADGAKCVGAIIDAQHDAQAAVRFLRKNAATYNIDPDRIAVGGTSAGAITALRVAYNPTDVGNSGTPGVSSTVRAAISLSGATVFGDAHPGDAPTMLFHGTADPLVPYQWAVNTVNSAHAAGDISILTTWDGDGHVPYTKHRQQILDETTNFLWHALDLEHAAHQDGRLSESVLFEVDGHVATITYNRPDALNAIDGDMRRDLNAAFARFRDDEDLWVAIVTGAGRAFCVGADLRGGGNSAGDFPGTFWEKPTQNSFESGWEIFKPVIAAVNGYCLGYGLTLVTWCDFVIASQSAEFGFPEAAIGVPTIVGAIRLPQRINWQYAMEILLTGERFSAARAKEIGLVGWVVPPDDVMPEARALAARLVRAAPLAQRAIKEVAVRSQHMPLLEAIRFGETMRKVAAATEDASEGIRARIEGRPPEWRGR